MHFFNQLTAIVIWWGLLGFFKKTKKCEANNYLLSFLDNDVCGERFILRARCLKP